MLGPLLHRDLELEAIGHLLDEVRTGRPGALVIDGDRGIGKTTLLRAAATHAAEVGTVLLARCHPSERDFPLAMLRQLFDHGVAGAQVQDAPTGGPATHSLLDVYYQAACALARDRPVVIALDDAGDADRPSLQWSAYLARRLHDLPVGIVVTRTADDRGGEDLLRELRALPYYRSIRPRPLCGSCSHDLLAQEYGTSVDNRFAAACHLVAQGNPLVLRNLARRLTAAGVPPNGAGTDRITRFAVETLAETTLAWLGERDPDSLSLAEGLALLGDQGDLETAAVLCGRGATAATRARLALRRAGLLSDGKQDQFVDGYARDTILERMGEDRRIALHEQAAALLFRLGSGSRHIATHVMSVGSADRGWVVPVLREAARDASHAEAWAEAAGYLRRALAERTNPGPDLFWTMLTDLAAVELRCHLPACAGHTETALHLSPDAEARCGVMLGVASPVFVLAAPALAPAFAEAANHLVGRVDAAVGRGPDAQPCAPVERDHLLLTTAQALLAGEPTAARPAARLAAAGGHRPATHAFRAALAVALAAGGRHRTRVERLTDWSGAESGPARGAIDSPSAALSGLARAWAEQFAGAELLARSAMRTARSVPERALARLVHADLSYRRGDLAVALAEALDAAQLAEECGLTDLRAAAAATAAVVHLEQGEPNTARALLRAGPANTSHPLLWSTHALGTGVLAGIDGDHTGALRWFLEAGRRLDAAGITNPACSPWRTLAATTHLALGQSQVAREVADGEVRLAQRWGTRGAFGRALSVAGAVRGSRHGLALQIQAVKLLTHSEHRIEYARAQIRLGTTHDEAGSVSLARDAFELALQTALACRATRLADQARARIRRRGPGPPHRAPADPLGLTTQELRVAELVVSGLSNLDVANQLEISKRTVDTHLAHIYRKLGIRSRRALAEVLATRDNGLRCSR